MAECVTSPFCFKLYTQRRPFTERGGFSHQTTNFKTVQRVGKWALALTEYSLTFMPLKAVKGQVISDFIVDHSLVEQTVMSYVEMQPWKLYFDGSTHRNGSGVGVLLISPEGIPTKFKYKLDGPRCSNNEAEYEALIVGLEALLELGATRVEIKGDSELVVKQITKEYKCIKENLMIYFVIVNRLLRKFEYMDIQHIPRIENQEANDLAQLASGYKVSARNFEDLVELRGRVMATRFTPSDLESMKLGYVEKQGFEILAINVTPSKTPNKFSQLLKA